jgi:hypothetical protein
MRHVATFADDDADELVTASLSCQVCLWAPASVLVVADDADPIAYCYCGACDLVTEACLTPAQAARLMVAPPVGPLVDVVR